MRWDKREDVISSLHVRIKASNGGGETNQNPTKLLFL